MTTKLFKIISLKNIYEKESVFFKLKEEYVCLSVINTNSGISLLLRIGLVHKNRLKVDTSFFFLSIAISLALKKN